MKSSNERHPISIGTRLNGIYEIERQMAVGGMGEIYAARAIETGVPVAIKMIRPELAADANIMALFRREALALHQLRHEAIVAYYVFSIDPELKVAYLAMEYVPGRALSELVRQGPLGFEFVRVLQKRVAAGLEAAHHLGVVHRDVSSDNIILPDGDPAKAKIIDFGIAKNTLEASTIVGAGFAGKHNYASPEQLGLFGGKVTAKSDVYSLGLVLTEALLGRKLEMDGNMAEVVSKRETVPDLTGVDRRLQPLIRQMLDPNPDNRPTMGDVATREVTGLEASVPPTIVLPARVASGAARELPRNAFNRKHWLIAGSAGAALMLATAAFLVLPFGSGRQIGPVPERTHQTTIPAVTPAISARNDAAERAAEAERQRVAQQEAQSQEAIERQRQDDVTAKQRLTQEQAANEERARLERQAAERQAQESAERQRLADLASAEQRRLSQERSEREDRARREQEAAERQRLEVAERQRQADREREQQRLAQGRLESEERERQAQEVERRRQTTLAIVEQQRLARERSEQADREERMRKEQELQAEQRRKAEVEAAGRPPQVASRTETSAPSGPRDCGQCPELALIPEGVMQMGSNRDPSERPIRHVNVKAFAMSRYPVTVAQWKECARAGACPDVAKGDERQPINNVSADDAQRYISWLSQVTGRSYRLPTEAEWEYAARAGTSTRYWWGEQFSDEFASCRRCGSTRSEPLPIGSFKPNAFGLYDMSGSVAQWVSDCWHKDYRGAPRDSSSWGAGRCREQVVRGGAWSSEPADQTVSSRSYYDPGVRHPSNGFRVVRNP